MKRTTLAGFIFTTAILAGPNIAYATEHSTGSKREAIASGKGAALFTSGALAGGAVGGPAGALLGALSGALIGEDLKRGAKTADSDEHREEQLLAYKLRLMEQEEKIAELNQATAESLQFQVLFSTGAKVLNHGDTQRVMALANYLRNNPALKVRLQGYADPRGTQEYNQLLSQQRAHAVMGILQALGIAQERISFAAHGASRSTASLGDDEAYALERRVNIEIYKGESAIAAN